MRPADFLRAMAQPPSPTEAFDHALEIISNFIEFIDLGDELACIDCNAGAATKGNSAVILGLIDNLLRRPATLAAWNANFGFVEHEGAPSVDGGAHWLLALPEPEHIRSKTSLPLGR
jgi:hypothetical protein